MSCLFRKAIYLFKECLWYMSHLMRKPTKWLCVQRRLSLIRVFAVRLMGSWGPKLSSCGQRRLWSDWADAQADLSLRWAHTHFVGFVMRWLIYTCMTILSYRTHQVLAAGQWTNLEPSNFSIRKKWMTWTPIIWQTVIETILCAKQNLWRRVLGIRWFGRTGRW